MSNAVFHHGPITFKVEAAVSKNRFVQLGAAGVKHADASSAVFGAVTNAAAPEAERAVNDLTVGAPDVVAVHYGPSVVKVEPVEGNTFKVGAPVYAGADGKAAATGTTAVGVAVRESDAFVKVLLSTPIAAGE